VGDPGGQDSLVISRASGGKASIISLTFRPSTPGFRPGKKENKLGLRASDTVTGRQVPVIWTQAAGLQRLPGLEGSALLAKESGGVIAINHVHQILGNIVMSTGQNRVVVWTLPDSPALMAQMAARMPPQ